MSLLDEIKQRKTISFSQYQELVLYHPEFGFYENGGAAGTDFLTSVELGPLFADVLGRAIDTWWDELGQPTPYYFVEVGAGKGTLAASLMGGSLRCAEALRYVAVERSSQLRHQIPETVERRAELPEDLNDHCGVVFANELLDNLPVDIYDDQDELRVKVKRQQITWARDFNGAVFPEQTAASKWVRDALGVFHRGRVVVVDYMRETAEMRDLPVEQWLRSYRRQGRSGDVFGHAGSCDITCDVAFDQIKWTKVPHAVTTQAEFLRTHGIDDFVEVARRLWSDGAASGDLAALKAKSRLNEAAALTDPDGFGGFTVVEWL